MDDSCAAVVNENNVLENIELDEFDNYHEASNNFNESATADVIDDLNTNSSSYFGIGIFENVFIWFYLRQIITFI